jgi:hypothetical protein
LRRRVRIGSPRVEQRGSWTRVSLRVAGRVLFFERDGGPLQPAVEAFVCALLPGAVRRELRLAIQQPVDPVFLAGAREVASCLGGWWSRPALPIEASTRAAKDLPAADWSRTDGPEAVGLCFTGGVDSFYSLLREPGRIGTLIYVHGYDVALEDVERARRVRADLEAVAAATSTRLVWLRSNLRVHPVGRWVGWEQAHGGALAAAGHLVPGLARLHVAASFPQGYEHAWGSTARTDPLWSSSRLGVVHDGDEIWRSEKLRRIASHEIVQRRLRICWEHRSEALNCGRCEKCVRTRLVLAQHGMLDRFEVFGDAPALDEAVQDLPPLDPMLWPVYRAFLDPEIAPTISAALVRQLERSRAAASRMRS